MFKNLNFWDLNLKFHLLTIFFLFFKLNCLNFIYKTRFITNLIESQYPTTIYINVKMILEAIQSISLCETNKSKLKFIFILYIFALSAHSILFIVKDKRKDRLKDDLIQLVLLSHKIVAHREKLK